MQTLNQLETEPIALEEEEKRHGRRLLIGLLCAVILTGTVLGGYLYLRKRHERQVAAANAIEIRKRAPRVEVFVDDATLNGKTTVLSGTIHNISTEPLHNLAVEIQLRKRLGSGVETRTLAVDPKDVPPDGTARYNLDVPVADYISATFFRVITSDNHADVAFKALPGAARPPLEAPASKSVIVKRPAPRGEEFINTPNTPGRVP
jgi:hypothetical protein